MSAPLSEEQEMAVHNTRKRLNRRISMALRAELPDDDLEEILRDLARTLLEPVEKERDEAVRGMVIHKERAEAAVLLQREYWAKLAAH